MFVGLPLGLGFGEPAESIPVGLGDAAGVFVFAEPAAACIDAGSRGAAGALVSAKLTAGPGDAAAVFAFAEPAESIPAGSSSAAGALVLAELLAFFASQEEEADICLS